MRIVVCAKEVLDPDAVNNYALEGRLVIGDDGKSLTQSTIPRLMNAYDEQSLECALRIRESGVDCSITVVSVGPGSPDMLKHCAGLGADEIVEIPVESEIDYHAVAAILAAYLRGGEVDLVLCGRQASDDDQGVVPALIAEALGMPLITIARKVEVEGNATIRVVRVTPDGDETVEVSGPAVVTISNELGEPRYPTMQAKMKARKRKPVVVSPAELSLDDSAIAAKVTMVKQFVPTVRGDCEFIEGTSPADKAQRLVTRLREENIL